MINLGNLIRRECSGKVAKEVFAVKHFVLMFLLYNGYENLIQTPNIISMMSVVASMFVLSEIKLFSKEVWISLFF